jgi:1-pyrroline-5-carboxylate dehydrogenase|tara:strand:+ start:1584 stop:3209 length:1626 start_codon:yes stop_codon:yes gene_type:complete
MANAFFQTPLAYNEPILGYAPGSPERQELLQTYQEMKAQNIDIPMYIGGKEVFTDDKREIRPPHELKTQIGTFNFGTKAHVKQAIDAALAAKSNWENLPWQDRASIFLRVADLISGPYRARINASSMLGQSKNAFQADIDAACEYADFMRYNVQFMSQIYAEQPESSDLTWNQLEYRPLEGFVFAVSPFNFTSIAGNLSASPAMMGNTVVWKPADAQVYSAKVLMDVFKEAGLPDGVINMVTVDGPEAGDVIFSHRDFAAIHFTGSTGVFRTIWKTIGNNIEKYRSYPRIVGETGGKDFIMVHPSAKRKEVSVAMTRGGFEFQGQKCSAASRVYLPKSMADEVIGYVKEDLATISMGSPEDFSNYINAVIDEKSFDKISGYIDYINSSDDAEIVAGGKYDKSEGYFIEPTLVVAKTPKFRTMCEEIFGPVLTVYCYDDDKYEETLHLLDETSEYALTGSIFSQDRYAIDLANKVLKNAAGNFYINDKPTGAVVGQQPFGGARGSGTNDKAGSHMNMLRWTSPRTIKETFVPATDYRYPFLG